MSDIQPGGITFHHTPDGVRAFPVVKVDGLCVRGREIEGVAWDGKTATLPAPAPELLAREVERLMAEEDRRVLGYDLAQPGSEFTRDTLLEKVAGRYHIYRPSPFVLARTGEEPICVAKVNEVTVTACGATRLLLQHPEFREAVLGMARAIRRFAKKAARLGITEETIHERTRVRALLRGKSPMLQRRRLKQWYRSRA